MQDPQFPIQIRPLPLETLKVPIQIRPLPLETLKEKAGEVSGANLNHILDLGAQLEAHPQLQGVPVNFEGWLSKWTDDFIACTQALITPPFQPKEVLDLLDVLIDAAKELPLAGLQKHEVVGVVFKFLARTFLTPKLGLFGFLVNDAAIDALIRFVFQGNHADGQAR